MTAAGAATWLGLTADFARARIAPGPRDRAEVRRMLSTSVAIPFTAVWHRQPASGGTGTRGRGHHRCARSCSTGTGRWCTTCRTTVTPTSSKPVDGAAEALERLRGNGISVGVVTNQSGVARGLVTRADVDAVNARIDALLGPFDTWQVCPHAPGERCDCRKPRPGMVLAGARDLGVAVGLVRGRRRHRDRRGGRPCRGCAGRARAHRADATGGGPRLPRGGSGSRARGHAPVGRPAMTRRILAVRLDNDGDVLLTGPAVRALAAGGAHVDLLVAPSGLAAAHLLPHVHDILLFDPPWSGFDSPAADPESVEALVAELRERSYDEAVIFTSFHQSPLPMALLCRLGPSGSRRGQQRGLPRVAAGRPRPTHGRRRRRRRRP